MKTTYELEVMTKCPVTPSFTDTYSFIINADKFIKVEDILEFFLRFEKEAIFQEDLTTRCADQFTASVTSTGWHSGVKTICTVP
jgi:hypothetical protein